MWRGEEGEGDRGEVENILAGVGGERWTMLEAVCARLELSAVALATSAWLLEGWPVEGERDKVCDRIWRAWDRLGDARLIEVMQGLDAWSRELVWLAEVQASVRPTPQWRAHVMAAHAWAWRVCVRQGAGFERVSLEVCDGVSVPERFSPPAPGRRAANTIDVMRWGVMGGRGELELVRGHEAGHWISRASVHVGTGQFVNYSGELCHEFATGLLPAR